MSCEFLRVEALVDVELSVEDDNESGAEVEGIEVIALTALRHSAHIVHREAIYIVAEVTANATANISIHSRGSCIIEWSSSRRHLPVT